MGKYQIWPTKNSSLTELAGTVRSPCRKLPVAQQLPMGMERIFSGWDMTTITSRPNKGRNVYFLWKEHWSAWDQSRLIPAVLVIHFLYILLYEHRVICLSFSVCFWGVVRVGVEWNVTIHSTVFLMLYFLSWWLIMPFIILVSIFSVLLQ